MRTIRLVQWLSWVFATQGKKRKTDVSTSKVSEGTKVRRTYPRLAHAVSIVSSVHVWSRSLSFQWGYLWSATKSRRGGIARRVSRGTIVMGIGQYLENTKVTSSGAVPSLVGGHYSLDATFPGS